jgi:hypothetical protein
VKRARVTLTHGWLHVLFPFPMEQQDVGVNYFRCVHAARPGSATNKSFVVAFLSIGWFAPLWLAGCRGRLVTATMRVEGGSGGRSCCYELARTFLENNCLQTNGKFISL